MGETDHAGVPLALPLTVDLAGTEWSIQPGMDWHPRSLEKGTRLELLNLHYMDYLSELAPGDAKAVVLDWIRHSPPYRPAYWTGDWNSYSLSIRVVSWMQLLERDPPSRAAGAEVDVILQSLAAQLRFLSRNLEEDIGGNHLIKNIRALLRGAKMFEGPEADQWGRLGARLLERELDVQILSDGMHFEVSPAYHLQVFADLTDCHAVLSESPVRTHLGHVLDAMAVVVQDTTHPDGRPSLFNDGGLEMTVSPSAALASYARIRERSIPPARASWSLPHAGYFGVRDGGSLVVVDAGALGPEALPAHAHGDALAFEWSVNGDRIVVDAGVYEYHAGAWRDYSRSTRAHNTVTLDDADQGEFWSSFRLAHRPVVTVERVDQTDGSLTIAASHDGYARMKGAPRHRRVYRVTPRRVEVDDEILGGCGQIARARLLLAPGVRANLSDSVRSLQCGETRVRLDTTALVSVEEGFWMPNFGVKTPTTVVVLEYGSAPCRGGFVLIVDDGRES